MVESLQSKLEEFPELAKIVLALDLLKHTDTNFPNCVTRIDQRT